MPAMAAGHGESAALRFMQRSVIAGSDPNDPTAVLDPVPNDLAGMTRGLRVGVDSPLLLSVQSTMGNVTLPEHDVKFRSSTHITRGPPPSSATAMAWWSSSAPPGLSARWGLCRRVS